MLQFITGFFLSLYCVLSMTIDPDKTSLHEEINQNNPNEPIVKQSQKQLLNEHLKVIITISSISVGIMVIIVCIFIIIKYLRNKQRYTRQTIEQREPLKK